MSEDDIERIEEGGTEPYRRPPSPSRRCLNAEVRLTAGHDLGSVWCEAYAA
jgi:hypothetical protein